jgi:hypothetical protein
MTNTYPGSNLEIIEKAIYCNEHGDAESCENWLNHLRERVSASAAPAEGREPDAWMVLAANTGKPCEVTLHKSETEALRQDCVVPLYRAEAGREAVDERAACELCKGVGQIGTPGQRCFACDGSGKSLVARAALATAPTKDDIAQAAFDRGLKAGNEQAVAQQKCILELQSKLDAASAPTMSEGSPILLAVLLNLVNADTLLAHSAGFTDRYDAQALLRKAFDDAREILGIDRANAEGEKS